MANENEIEAAHKREIRERDAEIIAKAIIIDAKDALIKELADELDKRAAQYCGLYGCHECDAKDCCETYELIKKAREMMK